MRKTICRLLIKKVRKICKRERPHLNSHLKITDFARDVGTNRTYLSRYINENYGMNFSTYINRLRLAEMKELKSSLHIKVYLILNWSISQDLKAITAIRKLLKS
jgi:AraC-like DNA-binding protein